MSNTRNTILFKSNPCDIAKCEEFHRISQQNVKKDGFSCVQKKKSCLEKQKDTKNKSCLKKLKDTDKSCLEKLKDTDKSCLKMLKDTDSVVATGLCLYRAKDRRLLNFCIENSNFLPCK